MSVYLYSPGGGCPHPHSPYGVTLRQTNCRFYGTDSEVQQPQLAATYKGMVATITCMTNSEVQSAEQYWLKPEQVDEMRTVIYECRPDYLQARDDALVTLMYDAGLRSKELVALDVDDLDLSDRVLTLAPHKQKQYPNENSPNTARLKLSTDTVRTLKGYLNSRWKDTDALFPSRSSPRMSRRAVRNLVEKLAREAEIRPYKESGGRGEPVDVSPHSLRHSVAYRMIEREDESLNAVKRRLRHSSIRTTELEYSHFDVV